jgi:hypothetical protein
MRYKVRSIESRGHWRSGRHWEAKAVEVDGSEITGAMRADPRLEIHEVVEEPVSLCELKRRKRGEQKGKRGSDDA